MAISCSDHSPQALERVEQVLDPVLWAHERDPRPDPFNREPHRGAEHRLTLRSVKAAERGTNSRSSPPDRLFASTAHGSSHGNTPPSADTPPHAQRLYHWRRVRRLADRIRNHPLCLFTIGSSPTNARGNRRDYVVVVAPQRTGTHDSAQNGVHWVPGVLHSDVSHGARVL